MANGSKWERDVCKILSKWINGSEKPYVYWRSAGSGSVFTSTNGEAGKEFAGDIYAIREEGKPLVSFISIECKSGYDSASLDKFLKYRILNDCWCLRVECLYCFCWFQHLLDLFYQRRSFPAFYWLFYLLILPPKK